MKTSLTIIIVERQAIFLEALTLMLGEYERYEVIATADSIERNGLVLIKQLRPDILLLNTLGRRHNDQSVLTAIQQASEATRTIVMTDRLEATSVKVAFENNVQGYFLKDEGINDLQKCINTVSAGHRYMSPRVSDLVLSGYIGPNRSSESMLNLAKHNNPLARQLTPREQEVLTLVARGTSKC